MLGIANSRMKDFFDLWVLSEEFAFDGATLSEAIRATFSRPAPSSPFDRDVHPERAEPPGRIPPGGRDQNPAQADRQRVLGGGARPRHPENHPFPPPLRNHRYRRVENHAVRRDEGESPRRYPPRLRGDQP